MRKRIIAVIIILLGAALLAAALLLFLHNQREDEEAGEASATILSEIESIIAERSGQSGDAAAEDGDGVSEASPGATPSTGKTAASLSPSATKKPQSGEMPVVTVGGYDYIGFIEIPSQELRLPVMSEWDYGRLATAPCRQFGSTYTDDLVIAAHNFSEHFGKLWYVEEGDAVRFTDMDGHVNRYKVEVVSKLNPTDVDAVQNSGYDLVLYTCTNGGAYRVVVFCNRDDTSSQSAKTK